MRKYHELGVWEIFIPQVEEGDLYKYEILTPYNDAPLKKADPFAFYSEMRPGTASIVYDLKGYDWDDKEWMQSREEVQQPDNPLSIYEVHLGSWMRSPDDNPGFLSYRELADKLVPYVKDLGYTHVELLPIAEHPYDPSWGYQITGYYAPTSRFGTPEDFMYLVDKCHRHDIGVLMDWVPAHFTKDEHGLRRFDGTALFEHEDPRLGEHKDWDTLIFNYGRSEVRNFLISNAVYWCDYFHIDGMRVDAVASMLYLDYSREEGEWVTNRYGGRENLEAIQFLKDVNGILHERYPGFLTMAEESTSWQGVTSPPEHGGLGFDYKWNMGWMNDTLEYFKKDPIYRKYHHDQLTFSLIYTFSEKFILPLSHDEVVHMKKSLVSKMPGDEWQKFANLRLLYTYMYGHPGKKLLFMGGEFGQWSEWSEAQSIDWHLLEWDNHRGIQSLIKDLNQLFQQEPPLHEVDHSWQGFEWIDISDADNSVLSFIRKAEEDDHLLFLLNFTPEVQHNYKFGVPWVGTYDVILNSDSSYYGGTDVGQQQVTSQEGQWHNRDAYIELTLPPLAGMVLKPNRNR
jgi:1,4-alpha-glucan branching enzyme